MSENANVGKVFNLTGGGGGGGGGHSSGGGRSF